MRADFWHRASEIPALLSLCEGAGQIDIPSASSAELAEMIRKPAQAAGLSFEIHAQSGLGLDAVIAEHAAAEPGILPLLSFTLDTLYAEDVVKAGGEMLSFATYDALGGLEGAIATRADQIVAALSPPEQAAVPRVLRALATIGGADQIPVARAAPLASFPAGSPARKVVDAFIAGRLLVAASEKAEPTVRLAHEALLSRWSRAGEQLAADRRDLDIRALIERQQSRWEQTTDRAAKQQLLLRDPDLANAIDLDRRWGDELTGDLRAFIAQSRATARAAIRRRWTIAATVILCLAALAGASITALYIAETLRNNSLIAQSRFLARDARIAVSQGNATLGALLALAALPKNLDVPDRPFITDAEYALEDAFAAERERVMLPHPAPVKFVSFSADGTRLTSAAEDKKVRIWDTQTNTQIAVLEGHTGQVWSAVFSPDGSTILTASDDQTIRLWDARTGRQLHFIHHNGSVYSASFSPDGSRMVTASQDKRARIFDARTGRLITVLEGHEGEVRSASFSRDGTRIVTGSADRTARVWDAQTGAQLIVLRGHGGPVASAVFSPDGTLVLTASADKTARIWDAQSGKSLVLMRQHNDRVSSASFSRDGTRIVTSSYDTTAKIYAIVRDTQLRVTAFATLAGHEDLVQSAEFSPDGSQIATASQDKTARLWRCDTLAQIAAFASPNDNKPHLIVGAALSSFGAALATVSADEDAPTRIWDVRTGRQTGELPGQGQSFTSVAFSPDGSLVATASTDNDAQVWNARTGEQVAVLHGHEDKVFSVAFSPDGTRIVTGSDDRTAREWDARSGAQIMVFKGHKDRLSTATFSPDGTRILTGAWDNSARVWDATSGAQILQLTVPTLAVAVTTAAFSPDGSLIATGSFDLVRIWDANSGALLRSMPGHSSAIAAVAFSPDGSRLASGSWDATARLWDARSGAQIAILRGHFGWVNTVAFSPDGSRLVTASNDGTTRIWNLPPRCQELIDSAAKRSPRQFSAPDRAHFFLDPEPSGWVDNLYARIRPGMALVLPQVGDRCG
jgi:WD40 repeat protein